MLYDVDKDPEVQRNSRVSLTNARDRIVPNVEKIANPNIR